MNRGFSLVELSIVLVILGLLTGGILAGQSLIRAAELRSVSSEYNKHITSLQIFRDKYFALPGDMTNAQSFWGIAPTCPGDFTTPSTDARTCNGSGNGQVTWLEGWRAWQHLASAGLVEGSYSGVQGAPADTTFGVANANMPGSKMGASNGWALVWVGNQAGSGTYFAGNYGNVLRFGSGNGVDTTVLKPEEAWNIDTKLDDGRPGYGNVRPYASSARANCTDSDTPSIAAYRLTESSLACNFILMTKF